MLFRGVLYSLALLLVALLFANVRARRIRQAVLLVCSYALYVSWGAWFAVILLISTVMNFFLACWLRKNSSGLVLSIGILLNLALLGSFKYLPEITIAIPLSSLQRFSNLALPLGISFWTFQAMSYLFDLYRGEEISPSFFEFALYMVFFPIAIAGPICRLVEMLPQFRSEKEIAWSDVGRGVRRIAIGILNDSVCEIARSGDSSGDGINSWIRPRYSVERRGRLVSGVWIRATALF